MRGKDFERQMTIDDYGITPAHAGKSKPKKFNSFRF